MWAGALLFAFGVVFLVSCLTPPRPPRAPRAPPQPPPDDAGTGGAGPGDPTPPVAGDPPIWVPAPPPPRPDTPTRPPHDPTRDPPTRPATPEVRVTLVSVTKSGGAAVAVAKGWRLVDADGGILDLGTSLRGELVLRGGPSLGGRALPAAGATLIPEEPGDLQVGTKRYPGVLTVIPAKGGGFRAAVIVDAETYLEGVLVGELPSSFPREAMRAQAVAARTYAWSERPASGPLEMDDTGLSDQEFGGVAAQSKHRDAVRDAVRSTHGVLVTWNGAPVRAWYHSTCGGATTAASNVFRSPAPVASAAKAAPLAGGVVCRGCAASPRFAWREKRIPGADVVRAAGLKGALEGVSVVAADGAGRATELLVRAGGKSARVSAAEFRLAVGPSVLWSTWIDRVALSGGDLVATGRGWGHGVGMCQFGAKGYADLGWTAEAILLHYYPGAALEHAW
ncbi:MAG: hypothetical protein HMLKMBBP_03285 [Planctomycetes bacterium]|nr:hypothetical protein [Planctomycetota bacterium]